MARGNHLCWGGLILVTSPTPNQRLQCGLPHLTMGLSWLLPPLGSFTTYLTVCVHHKRPRQTDCPGGFRSAQPMRTAYQLTRIGKTPAYCEVFTQPQNRVHITRSFWLEPPNSNCLGSDQFMPFALFTTLLGRVRLSQGNRWLYGILILAFLSKISNKYTCLFC